MTPLLPHEILGREGLELVHGASSRILSELGIEFQDEETLEILKAHGAAVKDGVARFDPSLVESWVAKAPRQFVQRARNPRHDITLGGDQTLFAPVYGPPFVLDLEGRRRSATMEDFQNFVRLASLARVIHQGGGAIVEPTDRPIATRHLDMLLALIQLSDKPFMGSVTAPGHAADSVAMAEILFGAREIRERPALLALINANSPRRYDARMLGALKVYARARQGVIITPFLLQGAMAPVTLAGALAQQNAEVLAGIVLTQMIKPGAPVVYGSFLTTIDFRSGQPIFGSPESHLGTLASAQLARRYGLPFRGGGSFTSSKIPDAQAAAESVMSLLPTVTARAHLVLHAAGWLENGLVASYEKFALDCETLEALHHASRGLDLSEESLAMDAIAEVPPGGQHLETEHTVRHFRRSFRGGGLFDYASYESWQREGELDARARANLRVRRLLREHHPPPLDGAIEEELSAFVTRRRQALG